MLLLLPQLQPQVQQPKVLLLKVWLKRYYQKRSQVNIEEMLLLEILNQIQPKVSFIKIKNK